MYSLGISYGHNASVCLIKDGQIIFLQSEERFNRIKNSTGIPELTLEYINENIIKASLINNIYIFQDSIYGYLYIKSKKFKPFQYGNYLDRSEYYSKVPLFLRKFKFVWSLSQKFLKYKNKLKKEIVNLEFKKYLVEKFNFNINSIEFVDHHTSHKYSTIPFLNAHENQLIFTLDGAGDFACATVSILKNGKITELCRTDHTNSLGNLYSITTGILGMKIGEHEYKVMGLAPYANPIYAENLVAKLKKIIYLESGQFKISKTPWQMIGELSSIFKYQRFDNISLAIQLLTEDLIRDWVQYWIDKTKIHNVALAGGVFMNVKANMEIMKLQEVNSLVVVPSSGDESCSIGAAVYHYKDDLKSVKNINHLYYGVNYTTNEIVNILNKYNMIKFTKESNINLKAAKLLSDNHVVARFSGPMEFGARALGNRSILANPSKFETVNHINQAIKIRDFWMPFCPSILEDDIKIYAQDYAQKSELFYMSIAVESKNINSEDLIAASHMRDKTIRPQVVRKETNESYYNLIAEFKKITGIGALLNTSFNLHGEPNVCSPTDAMRTFLNSDLKYMIMNDYLVEKVI